MVALPKDKNGSKFAYILNTEGQDLSMNLT